MKKIELKKIYEEWRSLINLIIVILISLMFLIYPNWLFRLFGIEKGKFVQLYEYAIGIGAENVFLFFFMIPLFASCILMLLEVILKMKHNKIQ